MVSYLATGLPHSARVQPLNRWREDYLLCPREAREGHEDSNLKSRDIPFKSP